MGWVSESLFTIIFIRPKLLDGRRRKTYMLFQLHSGQYRLSTIFMLGVMSSKSSIQKDRSLNRGKSMPKCDFLEDL